MFGGPHWLQKLAIMPCRVAVIIYSVHGHVKSLAKVLQVPA